MFWVYILENLDGKFYIGQTWNLELRLKDHNEKGASEGKYTRKNGPWKIVWSEEHPDRATAMRREQEIKSWKSARTIRERLLNSVPE